MYTKINEAAWRKAGIKKVFDEDAKLLWEEDMGKKKNIEDCGSDNECCIREINNTESSWYLVANTPGVDIRHKFDGQELILVENVNYQIANKIVRAVNSHEALIKAAKMAVKRLKELDGETYAYIDVLEKAIAQAEGK